MKPIEVYDEALIINEISPEELLSEINLEEAKAGSEENENNLKILDGLLYYLNSSFTLTSIEQINIVFEEIEKLKLYFGKGPLFIEKFEALAKKIYNFFATKCDISAFKALKKVDLQFEDHMLLISDIEKFTIRFLLAAPSEYVEDLARMMRQFTDGVGNINYEGGLLTLAQIRWRKQEKGKGYDFNPIIVHFNEFTECLDVLQQTKQPVRERIVVAGSHWISVDIEIKENGEVSVLFLDSLGIKNGDIYGTTVELMSHFQDRFPKANIFFSHTRRQLGIGAGCSVFALVDTQHLFRVEKYLGKPLFHYFSSQGNSTKEYIQTEILKSATITIGKPVTYIPVKLPLPLMREMKSTRLRDEIADRPRQERERPVNSRGEKALDAIERHFVISPDTKHEINTSLIYGLQKCQFGNALFLKYLSKQKNFHAQLAERTEKHTLNGLKKRILLKKAEEKSIPTAPKKIDIPVVSGLTREWILRAPTESSQSPPIATAIPTPSSLQ